MDKYESLKALPNAAQIVRIAKKVGSLQGVKHVDFVVLNDHPFDLK